jgi:ribose-phosphate pyrophosphokinase
VADRFVLAGPASRELGESVAAKLKIPTLPYDFNVFPDGETRLRLEEKISRSAVIVVQSTYPPTDQHMMQLLLISHHLIQEGARFTLSSRISLTRGKTNNFCRAKSSV